MTKTLNRSNSRRPSSKPSLTAVSTFPWSLLAKFGFSAGVLLAAVYLVLIPVICGVIRWM